MSLVLGLAQSGFPANGDVLSQVDSFAKRARDRHVDLLVFPENLMCPHEQSVSDLVETAQPTDGPFVHGMCQIARRLGLWIVFTMYEANPTGMQPFNTAVVVDNTGSVRDTYQKCHLYDAHGVRESSRMSAGNELCHAIRTPFGTLGIGICYDLRFPETARHLALCGCELLLFPAAWHDGRNKAQHWETLLRARAIENECFVAGVCHGGKRYVRQSHVFDPMGNELAVGKDDLLVCNVDLGAVKVARDAMPIFDHRRPELYVSREGATQRVFPS